MRSAHGSARNSLRGSGKVRNLLQRVRRRVGRGLGWNRAAHSYRRWFGRQRPAARPLQHGGIFAFRPCSNGQTLPAGFELAATATDCDFLYAPATVAGTLHDHQLTQVRFLLATQDYDFAVVTGTNRQPPAFHGQLRDGLIVRPADESVFFEGASPNRPLRGRMVRLPGPESTPSGDLRQTLSHAGPRLDGNDLWLGENWPSYGEPQSWEHATKVIQAAETDDRPLVFVLPMYIGVGGAERNMIEVLRALSDRYRFVVVVIESLTERQGNLAYQLRDLVEAIYELSELAPASQNLQMLSALRAIYRPDMIWTCNGSPWFSEYAVAFRNLFAEIPIVDQQVYDHREGWIGRYQEPGPQSFDRFVAINRKIQERFVNEFRIPPNRVDLIYHGLQEDKFRLANVDPEMREERLREFGLGTLPEPLLGFVGRLSAQKRPLDLLHLAAFAQREGIAGTFVMVGDGELADEVDARAAELGLKNLHRIPFCGRMWDLLPLLDGIVFTSAFEGLPIAMLEALCLGVPALATDVGDIRYVLETYGNGHVVPTEPGNLAGLERAFRRWHAELGELQRVALEQAEKIRQQFSSAQAAEGYHQSWQTALAGKKLQAQRRAA